MRGAISIITTLLLVTVGINIFIDGTEGVIEEGSSRMSMFGNADLELTPRAVNESKMEFTRDEDDPWSNLPMRPLQWYTIGEWMVPWVSGRESFVDFGEIEGPTAIWITLSCPEEITMDLLGSFNIDMNPIVESVTMRDMEVGPEKKTFIFNFETDGVSLEELDSMISIRFQMRGGSDDVVIHLGTEQGTGFRSNIQPLMVQDFTYYENMGLAIRLFNTISESFWTHEDGWEFDFIVSLDDSEFIETEDWYRVSGGSDYHYVGWDDPKIPAGEHIFRWEADYGYDSHSSGSYTFIIEEEEPPVDDDDDPDDPYEPPVDDDEDPPIIDDDPVELLDSSCCERHYTDAKGDDVFMLGSLFSYEYEIGERPNVDIENVNVWREGDELFIKAITGKQVEGWTVMVVYILPDDSVTQRDFFKDDLEDASILEYEPSKVVASNDIFAKGDYWITETERYSNSITVKGSMEDLMDAGMDEDFEVFVALIDLDPALLMMDDIYEFELEVVLDYGGYGAGKVKDESEADADSPSVMIEPGDIGGILVKAGIGLVVITITLFIVIFVIIMVKRRKK